MIEHAPVLPVDPNELPGAEIIYPENQHGFLEFLLGHPELDDISDPTASTTIPFHEPISTPYTYSETEKNRKVCRAGVTQKLSTDLYSGRENVPDGTKQDDD